MAMKAQNTDRYQGWTIAREAEYGGLWVLRRPDGTKAGQTQTEAGIKTMRRTAMRRAAQGFGPTAAPAEPTLAGYAEVGRTVQSLIPGVRR